MSKINEFLNALEQNADVKELLKNQPKPDSDEEAAAVYVSIAEKLGFSVTKEEMLNGLKGLEKVQQEKTGASDAGLKQALDEAALEQVAGGGADPRCDDTFSAGEWCWFTDSCSYVIRFYDGAAPQQDAPAAQAEQPADAGTGYPADVQNELEAFDHCGFAAARTWREKHPGE